MNKIEQEDPKNKNYQDKRWKEGDITQKDLSLPLMLPNMYDTNYLSPSYPIEIKYENTKKRLSKTLKYKMRKKSESFSELKQKQM